MRPSTRHPWHHRPATRLALAAFVLAAIGWRAEAAGPALRAGGPQPAGSAAEHHCKCGRSCRGASCCCSRAATAGTAPAPAPPPSRRAEPRPPRPAPTQVAAGPCWQAAPCGDPATPTASPVGPIGRAALLLAAVPAFAATSRPLVAAAGRAEPPADRADRIDEPPESPIGA